MDSIKIELENLPSQQTRNFPRRTYFQQASILKLDRQEKKFRTKKVQFKCRTSTPKTKALDNTRDFRSMEDRTKRSIFDDHDYAQSSNNSLTPMYTIYYRLKIIFNIKYLLFV